MATYHVGIRKGYSPRTRDTLYLEARSSVDCLSCETWLYWGERDVSKAELERNKAWILKHVNEEQGTSYQRIVMD